MIESVRRNHEATTYEGYDHLCPVRRQAITPNCTKEDRSQSHHHEEHNGYATVTPVSFDKCENTKHRDH
jgi:hypothetical protein